MVTFVGLVFTGCQKDNVEIAPKEEEKVIPFTEFHPDFVSTHKKGMIISEEGSVTDKYGHVYRTLI
ncbi:MAG: hypothetical protein RIS47_2156, partial [Bacteroidota bacterium]